MDDTIRLRVHNELLARGPSAVRDFCARHQLSRDVCRVLETLAPHQRSLTGGTKDVAGHPKPKKPEVVSQGITKPVKKVLSGPVKIPMHLKKDIDDAMRALPPAFHSTFVTWIQKNDGRLDNVFRAVLMYSHRYDSVINSMLRDQEMSKEKLFEWYMAAPRLNKPDGGTYVSDACNRMSRELDIENPLDATEANYVDMIGFGLKEHTDRFRVFVEDMVRGAREAGEMLVESAVPLEEDVVVYRGVKDTDWGVIEGHLNSDRQGFLSTTTDVDIARGFSTNTVTLKIWLKAGTMVTFPMACSFYSEKELLVTERIRASAVNESPPLLEVSAQGAGAFEDLNSVVLRTDDKSLNLHWNGLIRTINHKFAPIQVQVSGKMVDVDVTPGGEYALPVGTTKVFFPDEYNKPVDKLLEGVGSTITVIQFGDRFDQPVDQLPAGLTHLHLKGCRYFNQPVDRLPTGLTHLKLEGCWRFNQPVDRLPAGLTHLDLIHCYGFDQPVDQLPVSLTHLNLQEGSFNQPVDQLPAGLTHLDLTGCNDFDQPLDKLPVSLKHLNLTGTRLKHPIDNLPAGLTMTGMPSFR